MSWPRALAYLVTAVVLATLYYATAPLPPPPPASPASASTPERARPSIDAVRLEVNGRTVRARRAGEGWEVVEPAGAAVPSDLISALVAAVMETPAEPVAADGEQLNDFGLDRPSARLIFERSGAPPVTLSLGGPNPAATGVYGRLEGNPQVVLLGLNVRYYIDLVLKQSGG